MDNTQHTVKRSRQVGLLILAFVTLIGGAWLISRQWSSLLLETGYREVQQSVLNRDLTTFQSTLQILNSRREGGSSLGLFPTEIDRRGLHVAQSLLNVALYVRTDQPERASIELLELEEWISLEERRPSLPASGSSSYGDLHEGVEGYSALSARYTEAIGREREVDSQGERLREQYRLIRRDLCELLDGNDCAELEFEARYYLHGALHFFPLLPDFDDLGYSLSELLVQLSLSPNRVREFQERFLHLRENATEVVELLEQHESSAERVRQTRMRLATQRNARRQQLETTLLERAAEQLRPNSGRITLTLYGLLLGLMI